MSYKRKPKVGDFLIRNEGTDSWMIVMVTVPPTDSQRGLAVAFYSDEGKLNPYQQFLIWNGKQYTYRFLSKEEVLIYKMAG